MLLVRLESRNRDIQFSSLQEWSGFVLFISDFTDKQRQLLILWFSLVITVLERVDALLSSSVSPMNTDWVTVAQDLSQCEMVCWIAQYGGGTTVFIVESRQNELFESFGTPDQAKGLLWIYSIWKCLSDMKKTLLTDLLRRLIRNILLLNMTLQWHHLRSTFHKSKISLETFFFLCNTYINLNTSPCKICKTMFVYCQAQNNNVISVKSILINNILLFSSQICTWWYTNGKIFFIYERKCSLNNNLIVLLCRYMLPSNVNLTFN